MAGRCLRRRHDFPFAGRRGFPFNHPMSAYQAPVFLTDLLRAKSPSGAEAQAQAVYDHYVRPHAAAYANDALGNRLATLNPQGGPTLMLAGHMDELGLIITYVNKDGFSTSTPSAATTAASSPAGASSSKPPKASSRASPANVPST
jgi:hypothetical protein